jgi:diguanylate cyclase (GGDEF)-like protein
MQPSRSCRRWIPVSILIVDLDYFKNANDDHGHGYGDLCLISIARALESQSKRPYDLVARYGGDEFCVLLPDTGGNGAAAMADRIHAAVRNLKMQNRSSPIGGRLTVSIGAGVSDAEFRIGGAALVDLADRALMEAKRRGRNQTSVKTPISGPELVGGGPAAT